ncbi:MAG: hypothetical protein PHT55_05765 [Spirochaetales bacterium]|nr:hypothetical protein [Spirochaetales bacterium]
MDKRTRSICFAVFFLAAVVGLAGQGVSAVYETDFGELTIQQNGAKITGNYVIGAGRIEGTLAGRTLSGWWYQPNGKGRLVFVFSEDFSSFSGKWSYDSAEPTSVWNGKRTGGGGLLGAPNLAQPAPPPPPVAGIYDTDFKEMTLQLNGSKVTGTYTHADGKIEGTLEGRTLTGWWYQNNGKGRFVFYFSEGFDSFAGKWGYNDAEPTDQWNGKKKTALPSGGSGGQAATTQSPGQQAPLQQPKPQQASPAQPAQNSGIELFNNWNKVMVANNPSSATYFYISKQTTITRITNYHWNGGRGKAPGQIGLRGSDGKTYGPWQSTGTSGTGGAANVNWIVSPNVTLQPGFYQILDSDTQSWSHNSGSFGAGFSAVTGMPAL